MSLFDNTLVLSSTIYIDKQEVSSFSFDLTRYIHEFVTGAFSLNSYRQRLMNMISSR